MPSSTPTVLMDDTLKRNTTIEMISHAIPVIRNAHQGQVACWRAFTSDMRNPLFAGGDRRAVARRACTSGA